MGEDDFSLIDFVKDVTPIYRIVRDYNNMVEDPSLGNIGMFALSAAGDIPFIGAGFKALKAASKAVKAARNVSRAERALCVATRRGVARRARSRALAQQTDANLNNKIESQILLDKAKKIQKRVFILMRHKSILDTNRIIK